MIGNLGAFFAYVAYILSTWIYMIQLQGVPQSLVVQAQEWYVRKSVC